MYTAAPHPLTAGPVAAAAGAGMWYPALQPGPAGNPLAAAAAAEYMYVPVQVYDDTDYVELELPDIADPAVCQLPLPAGGKAKFYKTFTLTL